MQKVAIEASEPRAEELTYIVDEPASEDRFGAHSAIADAIISTIEKQSDIRLIGLFGRWGTGKSTIVGRLTTEIEQGYSRKYIVFNYDAWAHQGDPARRSILEELVARLVGLRLTKLSKWRKTLTEISGSTERSFTTTTTRLSGWGKAVVVLLLLLPLFASIIDADTVRDAFKLQHDDLSLNLIRGFLIYFGVLLAIIVLAYACSMNYGVWVDKESSLLSRFRTFFGSGEDILSIMLTRQIPSSGSTTLRRSQPTAIEFRRFLRRIIESQRPRKIIFVIDNLDRIDPGEALEIWSIMVGMVADEAHRLDAAIEPIVILPFDPAALEQIVPGSNLEGHQASDLIEKSFDVTFEVPPPVLSNWRSYFEVQYERCGLWKLTDESTFERYWTMRNFEQCIGDGRITPRKINRFLNRVISLSQQQLGRFSPKITSYYIAHEVVIRKDCLAFLKSSNPGFDDSNAWQRPVAAIAFGTTETEAAQVLLGDELLDALEKRNSDAFKSLADVAGFNDVVRNLVESPPRDDTGTVDGAPLTALAAYCARLDGKPDSILWSRLWGAWKTAVMSAPDNLAAPAMSAFLASVPDLAGEETGFLASRVVGQISPNRNPDSINELIALGDELADRAPLNVEVDLGSNAELLLKIIGSAKENSKFASQLRCESTFEDLADLVLKRVNSRLSVLARGEHRLIDTRVSAEQVKGAKDSFYESIAAGLKEVFANEESTDDSLAAAAEILATRDGGKLRYQAILSELQGEDLIGQALDSATQNGADSAIGQLAALQLTMRQFPDSDRLQRLSEWLNSEENARRLLNAVRSMNQASFLNVFHEIETSGRDVDAVLRPLLIQGVRGNNIGNLANTPWLLKIFRKVAGWLSATELTSYVNLVSQRTAFPDAALKLADSDFLLVTSKLEASSTKNWLAKRVSGFDRARLAKMISTGDEIWQAYSRLSPDIGRDHGTKSELFHALHAVLSGSLGDFGIRTGTRALKLLPLISASARGQLVRETVNSAIQNRKAETIVTLATMEKFGPYIDRPSVSAAIIGALFADLRRTRDGKTFIERHASAIAHIPHGQREVIKKALTKALSSPNKATAGWARFVLDKSGLER